MNYRRLLDIFNVKGRNTMNETIRISERNPSLIFEEFKKVWENEWKLKRITTFFSKPNFLITKYPIDSNVGAILETYDGTLIYIDDALCGYTGGGTSLTVDIIKHCIGFEDNNASLSSLIYKNDAVSLEFDEDGTPDFENVDTSYLFLDKVRTNVDNPLKKTPPADEIPDGKIVSGFNCEVDLNNQEILFFNPQKYYFNGLLNLIRLMDDCVLTYLDRPDPNLERINARAKKDIFHRFNEKDVTGINYANIIIEGYFSGIKYTIYAFVNEEVAYSYANELSIQISGNTLPKKQKLRNFFRK